MSSIQERLQLKRVPLDTWNIREKLCLASAVVRSGDQNWMSVSRALKTIGEPNRPSDWYSQKSCAAQYGALLEHVETPKRKKRNSEGAVETPQESILKRLTEERIVEIQKNVAEMNQLHEQLKAEMAETRNPATSEERLREMWANIEAAKRAKERENARKAALLKEREERRARAERSWRPSQPATPTSPVPTPVQQGPPSSPLLTSLLKSSPVVTTPQLMTHPANVVDVVSPSVTAPTLSMLLEKSSVANPSQHESRHAAIEHIKIQLQEIEHQLNVATTSGVQLPVPPVPVVAAPIPAVDIDDIEIKAEDVYAFRDVDINIPPVTHMHKTLTRTLEKSPVKKDEPEVPTDIVIENIEGATENVPEETVTKEEPLIIPAEEGPVLLGDIETPPEEPPVEEQPAPLPIKEVTPEPDLKISFPEVKFPTTEIKVIQPEEQKIKEEIKEPEVPMPVLEEQMEEITAEVEKEVVTEKEEIAVEIPIKEEIEEPKKETTPEPEEKPAEEPSVVEDEPAPVEMVLPKLEDIPLPPDEPTDLPQIEILPVLEPASHSEPEISTPNEERVVVKQEEIKEEVLKETNVEVENNAKDKAEDKTLEEIKREEDAEDCIPLKQMIKKDPAERPAEETHTETDDDTPMELSREEEKDGKKKRDYSRKKKSESRAWSGSESAAEASAPESPGGPAGGSVSSTDAERHHRLWRKSVMLVYSRLCGHKYASLFVRPISDEEAPDYSLVVKRPMDLSTIRKNIDNGVIRTTAEFQRDVLLMLSNALMYNSSEHSVYSMAKEMHEEAQCQLGMLLAAQAHAGLSATPSPRRKRRRPEEHEHQLPAQHPRKRVAH